MAFWITVAFAVLERVVPGRRPRTDRWDASDLPAIPTAKVGLGETIFAVLAYLLILGLVLWQQNIWVVETAGDDPLPLLNPPLWSFWIPWFLALAVLEIGYALIAFAVGRWTWGLAWVNVALNLAFAVPAVWLISRDQVLSAEFLATFRDAGPVIDAVLKVIPIIIVIVATLDVIDGFRKAYRGSRSESAAMTSPESQQT